MKSNEPISYSGAPAVGARLLGWLILGGLAAFIINNILLLGYNMPNLADVFAGRAGAMLGVPLLVYAVCIGLALSTVLLNRALPLRADAMRIHNFNMYLIRACFWAVLLVGLADAYIALARVEGFFQAAMSEEFSRNLTRARFVGPYVHVPLIVLGALIAIWHKGLGFHWLALLIVVAELAIVISRFVFSYEQALMGDLVRYWYAALFLFASAYTLFDDGHVRVDVLYAGFGATTKGLLNAWGALLLGASTAVVILWMGFSSKTSIINSPLSNFEITQAGPAGMYVKYQMAAFLGIFAITMLIQFVSYFLESLADKRGEPGHRDVEPASH